MLNSFVDDGWFLQIQDPFRVLGISKLFWSYGENFEDKYSISLLDLIEVLDPPPWDEASHLGVSLGGYLGMATADWYKNIFSCYPAPLPFPEEIEPALKKVYLFIGENERWCLLPQSISSLIEAEKRFVLAKAHHGFMSRNDNKLIDVYHYTFFQSFVSRSKLRQIQFDHTSLSAFSTARKINELVAFDKDAQDFVFKKIVEVVSSE